MTVLNSSHGISVCVMTQMQDLIGGHLNDLADDASVKFVVITGNGDYFTSGADFASEKNYGRMKFKLGSV